MNLGQIRTAIQQRGYATDTATPQTEMINAVARRIYGMRRWPFLLVYDATGPSTVVGTANYDLDATLTDLLHVDAIRLAAGTEYLKLDWRPPHEVRDLIHLYRENGVPQFWTRIDDDLHIWPRPDKVYTINVDYLRKPPDLSGDSDTPVLPAAYHDLLVWGPIAEMCFRQRDVEGREMALNEYGMRLVDMMNEYGVRQRATATEVERSGWWENHDVWLRY